MLKIYGRKTSINVMKVVWACAEMGMKFEREDVGGEFGRNRDASYLAMNPNGLVPTIDEDGFILWESNSIVRYLAAKHDLGGLCPIDPRVRAESERWMDWQISILARGFALVFIQLIRTAPEKRNPALVEEGKKICTDAFRIVDAHLANRAFLAGDKLTVGDIAIGGFVYRWLHMDIERPSFPNLERYYARLAERPGFRTHVMLPLT